MIEELQSMREKNDILQSEIDYFKEEYKKLRYGSSLEVKVFRLMVLVFLKNWLLMDL